MQPHVKFRGLSAAFCVSLSVIAVPSVRAASFSAELVDTTGGVTRTTPFHYQDGSYRYDMVDNGSTVVVLFDAGAGVVRMLSSAEKAYYEARLDEPMSRLADPFAWHAFYSRKAEVQNAGAETIDGIACTKQTVSSNGQLYHTTWWSEELGFPLKVDVPICARTVELRKVQRGPQDAALFAMPADYRKLAVPGSEPEVPAWAGEVANAPVLTPPFTHLLTEGKIVRMRPQAGKAIKFEAEHASGETCFFTVVGFKDGRPTSDVSGNSATLYPEQNVGMTLDQTPGKVDAIVVRCGSGSVKLKTSVVAAGAGARDPMGRPLAQESASVNTAVDLRAPETVDMASRFEVEWIGPGNPDDLIIIARPEQAPQGQLTFARVRDGNPVGIWAPNEPGEYEIRYVQGKPREILGRRSLTVMPVSAQLDFEPTALAGDWIEVRWTGPGADPDFVSIAAEKQAPAASIERTNVRHGNPVRIRVPGDPGTFQVRYVLGRATKIIGVASLTVDPVFATVAAPESVKAGTEFEVTWSGPGYPEDFVSVARADQVPRASLARAPARTGADTAKIRAPREAGTYELRYVLGRAGRTLATATIIITPP